MSVTKVLLLGTGAGFTASKLMDRVTTAFLERQSEGSKQREQELMDEPAYVKAAEQLAEAGGRRIEEEEAQRVGQGLHVGLGVTGGVVAGLLVARGWNPFTASLLSGLGMWLLVDEGANAAFGLTPPIPEFPKETHLRGLVGHLAYGAALGGLLAVGRLLLRGRS